MDNKLKIHRFGSKEEASAVAGETLNSILQEKKSKEILLLLSGGSALLMLDYINTKNLGENLSICMADERYSQDPGVNNFSLMQKTDFYKDALLKEACFFGTLPKDGENSVDVASRLEKNLKNWREDKPMGEIIITLGMGPDGHTASIFPNPDEKKFTNLFNSGKWVVAYDNEGQKSPSERITITLDFFKLIDEAIVFVCGREKKEKFDLAIKKQGKINILPATGWHEIKNVEIFTDLNI